MTAIAAVRRHIPVLLWARMYAASWLHADVIAGLTTAAVVIPKAMAYATIAGLPIQVGLYTSLIPLLVYAMFGTSRVLSVSTTTTLAIITGAELGEILPNGSEAELVVAAATLAFLAGVALLIGCVLRLGFLANFISEPVLTGFKAGIGAIIIVDQLPKILGIHFHKASLLQNVIQIFAHVPETSTATLLLGVFTLALIFALEKYLPHSPAPLIAVAVGVSGSVLGLREAGVETVGTVAGGLPYFKVPEWSLVEALWPGALAVALMSYTESVAAMRAFARINEPRPDPNQELLALGLANAATGIFGGMPAGGGTTQTAVNRRLGALTQLSGVITAAMALATLLFLAPLIGLMPQATLAAIIIAYSFDLINFSEFAAIRRIRKVEFWWAVIALGGIIMLGTLRGIIVAVIASLAALIHRANNPPVYAICHKRSSDEYLPLHKLQEDDELVPGLLIVRVEGRLYFGNIQRMIDKIHPLLMKYQPKVLMLDCRAIIDIEFSALKVLEQGEKNLQINGIALWLVAPNPGVLAMVKRAPLGTMLGTERIFQRLHPAVEHYRKLFLKEA